MCSIKDAKHIISRALVAFSLLFSAGCTVGPDYIRPDVEVNENWSQQGDSRVLGALDVNQLWWKTFEDGVLNRLIENAYLQNLPLQIAALRILEARAGLGIAIGQQYPQQQEVFGSVTKTGLSQNSVNGLEVDRDFWDYQAGFDAAWELDFWGRYRRGVQAAQANLIASAADYDNAIVSLLAEVARTYTTVRTFEVLIALTAQNARLQEEGLQIALARFNNGVTTELDVMQARTLLESTRAQLPQLQASLRQSQNALSTLLGQPTGQVQEILDEGTGIPISPSQVAVGLPAELLRRRPDVRSAELYAIAQSALIGVAKADLYPSFFLLGEVGVQSSSDAGFRSGNADFKNIFDSDSVFYSVGPGIQWKIFNYGRVENSVRVQDARFQELLVNYRDTVLRAAQEVEDSLTGFLKFQEAEVFEKNSVDAAKRSVEIALAQYREGAVDYQRVIDTQRALLEEETRLAQTRSSIATNLIAVYKALGGGWELRVGQPLIPEPIQVQMQERTNWGRLLPASPVPAAAETPARARDIPLLQSPE